MSFLSWNRLRITISIIVFCHGHIACVYTQQRELKRFISMKTGRCNNNPSRDYFKVKNKLYRSAMLVTQSILPGKSLFQKCERRYSSNIKCFQVTKSSLKQKFISSLNEATRREKDYLFTSIKPTRYFGSFLQMIFSIFSFPFEFHNFPRIPPSFFSIDLRAQSKIEKISDLQTTTADTIRARPISMLHFTLYIKENLISLSNEQNMEPENQIVCGRPDGQSRVKQHTMS